MRNSVDLLIKSSYVPSYAYEGDAGVDLRAEHEKTLAPGERYTMPTGVSVAVPEGYAALVVPRSGLAAHHGITVVNSPGLIDSGYRGEISVTLLNTDTTQDYCVRASERIAQLVVIPVPYVVFVSVDDLPESSRSRSGFGSSGSTINTREK